MYSMSASRPKIKNVGDVVDRINTLRKEIEKRQDELNRLESQPLQETTPEPEDFDYKVVILELFKERPESILNVDSVVNHITSEYGFVPSRETTSLRIGYLIDTAKKLERVEGKRGSYRLRPQHETLAPLEEEVVPSSPSIDP